MEDEVEQLSSKVRELITNPSNERFLSYVSIWEIVLKVDAGKLELSMPVDELISKACDQANMLLSPVKLNHILGVGKLPKHHSDPFDRLLISQARIEKMALISSDEKLKQYPVEVIW